MVQSATFFRNNRATIELLARRFAGHPNIDADSIRAWIDQFDRQDGELALRILTSINYYDQQSIQDAYALVHSGLKRRLGADLESTFFFPYGYTGDSSGAMIYDYRMGNQLEGTPIIERFLSIRDLPSLNLQVTPPNVVFVDDMVGSGKQAAGIWKGEGGRRGTPYESMIRPDARLYLAVVVGFDRGITHVRRETRGRLNVLTPNPLDDRNRVFEPACRLFTAAEKESLLHYCGRALPTNPKGHDDVGALVVFQHNCPDDSLPILWSSNSTTGWRALFQKR